MKPDIASLIAGILFEHPSLTIPGMGTFTRSYQEAQIQTIHRQALPPSAQIHFDETLRADDGLLQDQLCQQHGMSASDARAHIQAFVEASKDALARRESVLIPRMGRLFQDFEQRCRFSPENPDNLNIDAFGLPPVSLPPPLNRPQASAPVSASAPTAATPAKEGALQAWLHSSMPWVLLLSICILAITIYFISRDANKNGLSFKEHSKEVPPERTNTKPFSIDSTDIEAEAIPLDYPDEEEIDTEAPTLTPGTQVGIIIIGSFRNTDNATKLIQDLFRDGYEAYTDQKGEATRVGVQFGYTEATELQKTLSAVRRKYNEKAWVLDPEN